ncbi:MAG: T9SS type A sorting domain-containing protein [Bacteroidetes bacterium]|nr:T9SS type A sorting domain-containing protein [Bacteroidota bacterium]
MKSSLLIAGLLAFVFQSQAQTTLIPDANFEQALISLGYDTGLPDGSVPTAAIDTVTYLNVTNLSIADITGIEDFTALEVFIASMNNLVTADLSQNTALTEVSLNSNELTSVDVTQCPGLTKLMVLWNNLTTLDVTQNPDLAWLFCGYNSNLGTIDVSQNTALTSFFCYYSGLTSLDVSQNTALTTLDCRGNNLTQLDVSVNTNLTILKCDQNQITSLQLSQHSDLTELTCATNELTCLNIKNGNNNALTTFAANNNASLTCIEVDNPTWSETNWTSIDAGLVFSTDCANACSTAGLTENEATISLFPNPTNGSVQVVLGTEYASTKLLVNSADGKLINEFSQFTAPTAIVELTGEKGIYFITVISNDSRQVIRVVKN